ncbi:MAG: hypothetical protein HY000_25085 [Planctomycetes bacterium]|nr:hypothetical protein [Planctomycetota bacterium]
MKVLFLGNPAILSPWHDDFVAAIGGRYPVELYNPAAAMAEQFRGVEVVVDLGGAGANRTLIDAGAAAAVRLWQILGNGLDHVDVAYFLEKRVPLAHTPGLFCSTALAEHALFLMLCFAKNFGAGQKNVRSKVFYKPVNDELEGKTLGLIGLGASGRALAQRAGSMGMRIMAIDIVAIPPAIRARLHVEFFGGLAQLDRLLAEADYLSLHTPLTAATRHLIDCRAFGLMKATAVLINVARGGIVDEAALIEALQSGRIRGAGLDVFAHEPLDPAHPLLHMDNVIATPHVAGATWGTSRRRAQAAAANVARVAQGLPPLYQVTSVP